MCYKRETRDNARMTPEHVRQRFETMNKGASLQGVVVVAFH
jgi:hypothetical protein